MGYIVYTDGSCNNLSPYREGGWAFVAYKKNDNGEKEIVIQKSGCALHTTNNRMEMIAVIEAMKWGQGESLLIISDSKYTINAFAFASWGKLQYVAKNQDLIKEFLLAKNGGNDHKFTSVKFAWVRGHSGNEGNELADLLAENERECLRIAEGIPEFNFSNSPKVTRRNFTNFNR